MGWLPALCVRRGESSRREGNCEHGRHSRGQMGWGHVTYDRPFILMRPASLFLIAYVPTCLLIDDATLSWPKTLSLSIRAEGKWHVKEDRKFSSKKLVRNPSH